MGPRVRIVGWVCIILPGWEYLVDELMQTGDQVDNYVTCDPSSKYYRRPQSDPLPSRSLCVTGEMQFLIAADVETTTLPVRLIGQSSTSGSEWRLLLLFFVCFPIIVCLFKDLLFRNFQPSVRPNIFKCDFKCLFYNFCFLNNCFFFLCC